eukprot:378558-Rhodomonas_salina.3
MNTHRAVDDVLDSDGTKSSTRIFKRASTAAKNSTNQVRLVCTPAFDLRTVLWVLPTHIDAYRVRMAGTVQY